MNTKMRPVVFMTRDDYGDDAVDALNEKCDVRIWKTINKEIIDRNSLLKNIKGVDAIYCNTDTFVDKELLDVAGPNLKVIATMSVGHNHVDVDECKKRGIKVGYTPDVLTDATAELAVALLLTVSRRIIEAEMSIKKDKWISWYPHWMSGKGLHESVVGIVGFGRIGCAVAERLKPFGVSRILYASPSEKSHGRNIGAEHVSFDTMLKESDFVVVTCSLNDSTRGLFDEAAFSRMKSSAIFVNISRGDVVDQDALVDALKTGKIFAAGLDVCTPEPVSSDHILVNLPNCVLLPHIGSSTVKARDDMTMLTSRNVLAGLFGEPLPAPLC